MAFQVAGARRWFHGGAQVVSLFPTDGSRLTVRLLQATVRCDPRRDRAVGLRRVPGKGLRVGPPEAADPRPGCLDRTRLAFAFSRGALRLTPPYRPPGSLPIRVFDHYVRAQIRKHFSSARLAPVPQEWAVWDRSIPTLFIANHSNWWDGFLGFVVGRELGSRKPSPDGCGEPRALSPVPAGRGAPAAPGTRYAAPMRI